MTCVKKTKNLHKYLVFLSVNFLKIEYSARQGYTFSIFFSKNSTEQILLNLKKR